MQLINNQTTTDLLRRITIGLGLGVFIVAILWMVIGSGQSIPDDHQLSFDSETIDLEKTVVNHDETDTVDDTVQNGHPNADYLENPKDLSDYNNNANAYPFFSKYRASLNSAQLTALNNKSPVLSIIITGAGASRTMNDHIIKKLSNNIAVSLSPYLNNHNEIADNFGKYGFETWMDLAAITMDMNHDHGNLALTPTNNFERNIDLLTRQLENKDKIAGVLLPAQSLINETDKLWTDIVSDLFAQGYGVIDNTVQIIKPALFFYKDKRAPYIKTDQVLNDDMSLDDFKQSLQIIRKNILDQGSMIISIPLSSPAALDILAEWVNSLELDNITLVPISAQAKL